MPLIIGKSSTASDQIAVREWPLEIQLFEDADNMTAEDIFNRIKDSDIYHIHTPIVNRKATTVPVDIKSEKVVTKVAAAAQMVAELRDKDIGVVLHIDESSDFYIRGTIMLDAFMKLIEKYPNVYYLLENTTPFGYSSNGTFKVRSGFYDSPVKVCRYLRTYCSMSHFYTLLDTCHAVATCRSLQNVHDLTLDNYFKIYADTCGAIHMADVVGLGINPEIHGLAFTKDRIDAMREQVQMYRRYHYKCPIVLEIQEDNYMKPANFLDNRDMLEQLFKEKRQ